MKRPQIVEVDYFEFKTQLRRATNSGRQIEITDKKPWQEYIQKNKIPDAALAVHARSRSTSGKLKQAIIADDSPWDGYYVYSPDEEFCLKLDLG